jgi:hypothetical protein
MECKDVGTQGKDYRFKHSMERCTLGENFNIENFNMECKDVPKEKSSTWHGRCTQGKDFSMECKDVPKEKSSTWNRKMYQRKYYNTECKDEPKKKSSTWNGKTYLRKR